MLARGQVPTSLLFSGPEGVGKLDAAMNLARALNCARAVEGSEDGCGECAVCRRIDTGNFPDVRVIRPEGAGRQIKAELVRQVVTESSSRPFEGRKRVTIFEAADRMNPTSANTLLKTLEEAFSWNVLILITSLEAAILPTLLSRCQRVRFIPLLPEEVTEVLVSRHGFEPDEARLAASVSGGSLTRALGAKTDELMELRREALEIAGALAEPLSRADLFAGADRLSKHKELSGIVRMLVGLLRDVSCIAGGESTGIVHFDLARELAQLASRAPLDAWLQAYVLAEETLRDLDVRYANKRITLENLFLTFAEMRDSHLARGGPAGIKQRRS
jgi:DNA polymerase-3 subunit delta'